MTTAWPSPEYLEDLVYFRVTREEWLPPDKPSLQIWFQPTTCQRLSSSGGIQAVLLALGTTMLRPKTSKGCIRNILFLQMELTS